MESENETAFIVGDAGEEVFLGGEAVAILGDDRQLSMIAVGGELSIGADGSIQKVECVGRGGRHR